MKDDVELIQRASLCIKVSRALIPELDEELLEDLSIFLMHIPTDQLEKMYDRVNAYRNDVRSKNDADGST
jgi:hypothetical protein